MIENLEKTYLIKIHIHLQSITYLKVIICTNMFLPNYLQFFLQKHTSLIKVKNKLIEIVLTDLTLVINATK